MTTANKLLNSAENDQAIAKILGPGRAEPETFILYYIKGPDPHIKQKHFVFAGEMKDAIQRGKRHCENMSYRFIRVQPFFSSLDEDEKRNANQG